MSNGDIITHEDIAEGIPLDVRAYFNIGSPSLPRSRFETMVGAFHEAINLIIPKIRLRKRYGIYFGSKSSSIRTQHGILTFTSTNPDAIAHTVEDFIFIDCEEVIKRNYIDQVVIFLEELVHLTMNVMDEDLTSEIVVNIYDVVELVDGKYSPK